MDAYGGDDILAVDIILGRKRHRLLSQSTLARALTERGKARRRLTAPYWSSTTQHGRSGLQPLEVL
jgi:hypothetical protein